MDIKKIINQVILAVILGEKSIVEMVTLNYLIVNDIMSIYENHPQWHFVLGWEEAAALWISLFSAAAPFNL